MPQNALMVFLSTHQWIIYLAILWTFPWKGVALWKAARRGELGWFVVILILNTVGILEIIYIFAVARKKTLPDTENYQANDGSRRRIV